MSSHPIDSPFPDMVRTGRFVVLDTETTGLGSDAEICQLALIDSSGAVLLDHLVKPQGRIPADATRIHGITTAMVANAPTCAELLTDILAALPSGLPIIAYNAAFDRKMLQQSFAVHACLAQASTIIAPARWHCAMIAFSAVIGERSRAGGIKWQPLRRAASHYGISQPNAHSAVADCQTTLRVCRAMAGIPPSG